MVRKKMRNKGARKIKSLYTEKGARAHRDHRAKKNRNWNHQGERHKRILALDEIARHKIKRDLKKML